MAPGSSWWRSRLQCAASFHQGARHSGTARAPPQRTLSSPCWARPDCRSARSCPTSLASRSRPGSGVPHPWICACPGQIPAHPSASAFFCASFFPANSEITNVPTAQNVELRVHAHATGRISVGAALPFRPGSLRALCAAATASRTSWATSEGALKRRCHRAT